MLIEEVQTYLINIMQILTNTLICIIQTERHIKEMNKKKRKQKALPTCNNDSPSLVTFVDNVYKMIQITLRGRFI